MEKSLSNYQQRVWAWLQRTFDVSVFMDKKERAFRFGEEALELLQAGNVSKEEVIRLVDYVYSRPVGEFTQEVGGTMVCLASLCQAHSVDMALSADIELARIEQPEVIAKIQAKQAAKPHGVVSPLPGIVKEEEVVS